jgi:hypothetical protein
LERWKTLRDMAVFKLPSRYFFATLLYTAFWILPAFFDAKTGFWGMTCDEKIKWNQWWKMGEDF